MSYKIERGKHKNEMSERISLRLSDSDFFKLCYLVSFERKRHSNFELTDQEFLRGLIRLHYDAALKFDKVAPGSPDLFVDE